MNERIEELKKQAMIRVNNPTVNSAGKVIHDNWEEGISISKFAELIVKECMTCCDIVEKVEWIDPPTYELGVKACKVKIQTHFGVKE